jgi:hypothetical protein
MKKKIVSDFMSNLIGPSKQNQALEVSAEAKIETAVLRFMTPRSLVGYQRTFGLRWCLDIHGINLP